MRLEVEAGDAGARIDQWLSTVEGIGSRSAAEKLLRDGVITVNGKAVAKSLRVSRGDVVEIPDAALVEAPKRRYTGTAVSVLYEDDDVLVVDKPAGMVVHPAPGHKNTTLVELLAETGFALAPNEDPKLYRPGVVHRLDKDTSGVIMFAKTAHALRTLQASLASRDTRREYLALVQGHVPSRAGRIEAPMGRDVRNATLRSLDTDMPKDAITHFVVTEVLPSTTLLRVRLETGRTHQIRVHMQAIGHPVIGDTQYGDGPAYGLNRQFLHAARLQFPHPVTGEPMEVASPLPEELHAALGEARRS